MSGLSQLLLDVQSADSQTRTNAYHTIEGLRREAPAKFLLDLAQELSADSVPKNARLLAASLLRNTLHNATNTDYLVELWVHVDPVTKGQIRSLTLSTLAAPDKDVRNAAAQAVAAIATLDIPKGEWPDILGILVANAGNTNPSYKQASIITLGFICEDLDRQNLAKQQSDQILTAIAGNLSAESSDPEIKLDALKALSNALKFARPNFENDGERQFIIGLLCIAAQHADMKLRILAFQVLCDVAMLYYDFIGPNLPEIWNVTCAAINHDDEQIGVLAIEFWNSIGDIEKERQQSSSQPYHGYISRAAATLLPLLLSGITKYRPADEEEWTIRKSSATNLTLLAQLTGDVIVDPCMEFVSQHISAGDSKMRNSAAMVFGSILEGPTPQKMGHLVSSGIDVMLRLMMDSSLQVRVTAAWVLGRICDFYFAIVTSPAIFPRVVNQLLQSLHDSSKVGVHICWSFISLIDHGDGSHLFNPTDFEAVLSALLEAASSPSSVDSGNELQLAAFSSICTLIEKSPAECVPLIDQRIPTFLSLLKGCLHKTGIETVQAFICSAIQSTCAKVPASSFTPEKIAAIVDTIVELFQARQAVVEEGIQAIGALAQTVERGFEPHLGKFGPFLIWALKRQDEVSVCKAGTMCVGDIARALGDKVVPFLGELVPMLLSNLEKADISTDVKIQSISSLADLASNSRNAFLDFLPGVLHFIEQASAASATPMKESDNPDLWEYLVELREAILQFYVGLLQGLTEAKSADHILGSVPKIIDFALYASQEMLKPTQDMHVNALGLIGDVAVAFGERVKAIVSAPQVQQYVQRWANSPTQKVREVALWTQSTIIGIKS